MKKTINTICMSIIGAVAIVACSSGSSGNNLQLTVSPSTCSLATNEPVTLSWSGLESGVAVTSNTYYNGTLINSQDTASDLVGGSEMPISFTGTGNCQDLAESGIGVYKLELIQGSSSASSTITVTP